MTLRARLLILSFLAIASCDAPKREEVTGLQQRLDTLAAEQTELRKQTDAATAGLKEQLDRANTQTAALETAKKEIEELKVAVAAMQAKLDAPPPVPAKPVLPGRPDPADRYRVTIDAANAEGSADAKVTIVIFSDFQCPFCARAQTTLEELQKDYGSDLRLVAKHNPLPMHSLADEAAQAAEAAGKQGKFWEMYVKLFENNKALTTSDIEGYAKDLKLDLTQFRRDIDSTTIKDRIESDKKQARELGASGTPAFFINGKFLSGAQPRESFKKVIDAEIGEADKLIASGTTRSGLYDALMASAKPGVGLGR